MYERTRRSIDKQTNRRMTKRKGKKKESSKMKKQEQELRTIASKGQLNYLKN